MYTHTHNTNTLFNVKVKLLLTYAEQDVRKSVRHYALIDLHLLSVKTPQCWEVASTEVSKELK